MAIDSLVVDSSAVDRLDGIVRGYLGKCARRARAPHILFSLLNFTSFRKVALAAPLIN